MCFRPSLLEKLNECQNADTTGWEAGGGGWGTLDPAPPSDKARGEEGEDEEDEEEEGGCVEEGEG